MIDLDKLENMPPLAGARAALHDAAQLAYVEHSTEDDVRRALSRVFAHVGYALGRLSVVSDLHETRQNEPQ